MLMGLLIGIVVGFISFGGLAYGTKIIFDVNEKEAVSGEKDPNKVTKILFACLILIGQLFLAGAVLTLSPQTKQSPMAVATGLVSSIFVFYFVFAKLREKE